MARRAGADGDTHSRFRVGTRVLYQTLADGQRGTNNTYLGSINELDVEQSPLPTHIYLQWLMADCVGIEVGLDSLRAKTVTWRNQHSDGTFDLFGPYLALFAQYPKWKRVTPLAGVGLAVLRADFEDDPVWHNGFSYNHLADYYVWRAAGSPPWPNNGYQRSIDPRDTTGLFLLTSVQFNLNELVSLDLFFRYVEADVDARYDQSSYGVVSKSENAVFPLSSYAVGAGVLFRF